MISWEPITLNLHTPFRIAHGVSLQRFNVIVHIGDGIGEAAAVAYHGESQEGILAYLSQLGELDWNPFQINELLAGLPMGSRAARAGIDIALHDLLGKALNQPLYRILGLNPDKIPPTSFTIAMDEPGLMAERARQANLPIIKVKLGGPDDEAMVSAIRKATSSRLRADANGGWTREQAIELIPRLASYDLEFIEQPLSTGDIEGLHLLKKLKLGLPIFADEGIRTARDVAAHAGAVDGVVIKLMKSCGLREAIRSIHTAHALGMEVMLGCMVETSVGVSAAAQIAPLCEYVDLDGPLLIDNDPYQGVIYQGARLILPDLPGIGVRKKEAAS